MKLSSGVDAFQGSQGVEVPGLHKQSSKVGEKILKVVIPQLQLRFINEGSL